MVAGCNVATELTYYTDTNTDNDSWSNWTISAATNYDPQYVVSDVNDEWDAPNNERC